MLHNFAISPEEDQEDESEESSTNVDDESACREWEWSSWSPCSGFCIKEGEKKNIRTRQKVFVSKSDEAECGTQGDLEECGNIPCPGEMYLL